MAARTLPDVSFTTGIAIDRMMPRVASVQGLSPKRSWLLIGLIDYKDPFLLAYQEGGVTQWTSPVALGDGLRKKILGRLREQVREAASLPGYITVHDLTHLDLREADAPAAQLWQQFFDQQWRANTLNDRDEDWLALTVPFAEKDQAKALGAKWDAGKKVWVVRVARREEFTRWLPDPA